MSRSEIRLGQPPSDLDYNSCWNALDKYPPSWYTGPAANLEGVLFIVKVTQVVTLTGGDCPSVPCLPPG